MATATTNAAHRDFMPKGSLDRCKILEGVLVRFFVLLLALRTTDTVKSADTMLPLEVLLLLGDQGLSKGKAKLLYQKGPRMSGESTDPSIAAYARFTRLP